MELTPFLYPLLGGTLIGAAAILLLLADGKIAGVSGILGGLFRSDILMNTWRVAFIAGLMAGGFFMKVAGATVFEPIAGRSMAVLILAGLLVGVGTQLGSGCTSGHGVCGIGRGSARSLVATLTFIVAGALTVVAVRLFTGAAL